jgi:hypothetical protein
MKKRQLPHWYSNTTTDNNNNEIEEEQEQQQNQSSMDIVMNDSQINSPLNNTSSFERPYKARPPPTFERTSYGTPVIYARTDIPSVHQVLMANARAAVVNNNSTVSGNLCLICQKQISIVGNNSTTINKCNRCTHTICTECIVVCCVCNQIFCTFCTETNYDIPNEDRIFCLKHVVR